MTDFTTDIAQALVRKEDLQGFPISFRSSRQYAFSDRAHGVFRLRKIRPPWREFG